MSKFLAFNHASLVSVGAVICLISIKSSPQYCGVHTDHDRDPDRDPDRDHDRDPDHDHDRDPDRDPDSDHDRSNPALNIAAFILFLAPD
jgi:ABC-type Zn2+ transport system substrate-binding protein/surface adhesin